MKVARLREVARRDVEGVVDYYAAESGEDLALRFVDALERALDLIARHPAAGSPRFGYELQLPGLRAHTLREFPYLVFYMERDDFVDVWRVLHGRRDVPAWLLDQGA
jgi:toxin ParE1/3/4